MRSLDEVFELFSSERRRFALYYLEEADGKVHVDELAEQIERWESDPESEGAVDDRYDEMRISLEHTHLPKVREAEHVEYERENQQLRISGLSIESDVLLSVTKAIERPSEPDDIDFGDYR